MYDFFSRSNRCKLKPRHGGTARGGFKSWRLKVKHSKYFCLPTLKIAHSISSATDSTLTHSDIGSVSIRYAADFMNLDTAESKVQCSLGIVLKSWDSYILWPTSLLLLNAPYCYITPQLVLSKNMPHLPAVTLWLLIPICWNTSNKSAAVCFSCFFSLYSLQQHLCTLSSIGACFMLQRHQINSLFTFMLS